MRNTVERFWSKVDRSGGPDACWLWTAGTLTGYGTIRFNGKQRRTHRVAWEVTHGPIPEGAMVLHDCPGGDNKLCCNPAHLSLGTHQDNMADAVRKGQMASGERHGLRVHPRPKRHGPKRPDGRKKLTPYEVSLIRTMWAFGATQDDIAQRFGVVQATVWSIVQRKTWKYI